MGEDDVTRLDGALKDGRVLLVQLEVPLGAVMAAAQPAWRPGLTLILDPAPARAPTRVVHRDADQHT